MRDERILEACPSCGSGRLICVLGTDAALDLCLGCFRSWERLPAGEPYTVDGEQMAFRTPCDNCAFRGGSTERANPDAWADLQSMLANGGEFYCHKGVPFKIENPFAMGPPNPADIGFEFPHKESSVDLAGATHPYQHYDKARMRLCRGFLNAHVGPQLKKVFTDA